MTLTFNEAKEAAAWIGIFIAGIMILPLTTSIGELSTESAVNGAFGVVHTVSIPNFGLILALLIGSYLYSQSKGF